METTGQYQAGRLTATQLVQIYGDDILDGRTNDAERVIQYLTVSYEYGYDYDPAGTMLFARQAKIAWC